MSRCAKVVVAPRPPRSNTGTFVKIFVHEVLGLRRVAAGCLSAEAQAAR